MKSQKIAFLLLLGFLPTACEGFGGKKPPITDPVIDPIPTPTSTSTPTPTPTPTPTVTPTPTATPTPTITPHVRKEVYQDRYPLSDVFAKQVDNRGNGDENLYGVRNFRKLLDGILYRGGANNYYHRSNARDNENPLPEDGLSNLCQEGFSNVVYLYTTNFSTATKDWSCSLRDFARGTRTQNHMKYLQLSGMSTTKQKQILALVKETILDETRGPMYIHCWNGWHASGLVSALSLRQFCDWNGEQAVDYWNRNTDGNNQGTNYDQIRQSIRDFRPYAEYQIDQRVKDRICP